MHINPSDLAFDSLTEEQAEFIIAARVKGDAVMLAPFGDLTAIIEFSEHVALVNDVFGKGVSESMAPLSVNGNSLDKTSSGVKAYLSYITRMGSANEHATFSQFLSKLAQYEMDDSFNREVLRLGIDGYGEDNSFLS
jgi:hypothetical protein